MGLLDNFLEKRLKSATDDITKTVTKQIISHVDDSLVKAGNPVSSSYSTNPGLKRYQFDQSMVNGGMQRKNKPGSNLSFETMRTFSKMHEVTRACINLRKRQITGLEWDITATDKNDTTLNDSQVKQVKEFFKNLGGRGENYRRFMDKFIEDLMVLDAVALEKQHTRGAGVSSLIPIDAATIRLRVDETGALPEPPETAFVQVIRGQITAEMTADEMIYEMMNPRNDSPYGLSPIESLVIIITSSLKAGTYNLAYLTDTNVPEGLFTMPEGWQPQAIQDFQDYFDALMAGNESETRRMKFMPDGKYVPTKKPTDMAFEQFNDWLMKITCALFEVTPIEIGFNPKTGLGGVGFSEVQGDVAEKKGIMPMAKFIEEIFTKIIQEDLGFPDLQFTYTGLIEHDEKSVAELNAILINSGQRTVNELRTDDGLDPIDGLDKPFVTGQVTFLDQESQDASANAKANLQSQLQDTTTETVQEKDKPQGKTTETDASAGKATKRDSESSHVELVSELRTFRKYALARSKAGKSIRAFESEVLPESTVTELNDRVQKSADQEEIKSVFKEYMDDYQINFLADVDRLRKQVAEVI